MIAHVLTVALIGGVVLLTPSPRVVATTDSAAHRIQVTIVSGSQSIAARVVPSAWASPESGATPPDAACELKVFSNPALVDGAKRYLMRVYSDRLEVIGGNAFQFATESVAAAVLDAMAKQFADFDTAVTVFASQFAPAAGFTFDGTVAPVPPPRLGSKSAAFAGSIDARAASGEHFTTSFGILIYQQGTIVVQLTTQLTETATLAATATPVVAGETPLLNELTALAHQLQTRSPGGPVAWSRELGHCAGGLFDVLPGPEDVTGLEVVIEQQMVGSN